MVEDEIKLNVPPEDKAKDNDSNINNSKKDTIMTKIEDKAKAFIKSDKIRDPQSSSEFLTKNTMRLIEKTYWFLGIILAMFIIVAIFRESIIEVVLPLFTLVIGGILGFMSKDLLRNSNQSNV